MRNGEILKKKKNIWMKEKFDTRKLRENSELQVKSHDLLSSESSDAHVFYYVRPLRFSKNV